MKAADASPNAGLDEEAFEGSVTFSGIWAARLSYKKEFLLLLTLFLSISIMPVTPTLASQAVKH